MAFIKRYHIKNYHKAKKVYTKEEIEKKQSNLKKLGGWGLILTAVGFILDLVLVVFAEAFLVLLPNSLDFYLFLFACAVLLTGLVLKLTSMHVFAKKNKE
jgi:archaellum biogenesis protein FlaJ (TadC family)